MKFLRNLFLFILILAAAIVVGKNWIASAALTAGAKMITGLDAKTGGVKVGLFSTSVGVNGLEVKNPSKFQQRVMFNMPEIFIDYKLADILKGNIHLEQIRLNLQEFYVVKAADGALNINSIQALQQKPAQPGAKKPAEPSKPQGPAPKLTIDRLDLKVGKVVYLDYTKNPPAKQEFNVDIDEKYTNITDPYTFAGLVVSRALMKTSVAQLANFDVRGLTANVDQLLSSSAAEALNRGTAVADKASKEALGTAKDVSNSAEKAVGEATGAFKKLLGQ